MTKTREEIIETYEKSPNKYELVVLPFSVTLYTKTNLTFLARASKTKSTETAEDYSDLFNRLAWEVIIKPMIADMSLKEKNEIKKSIKRAKKKRRRENNRRKKMIRFIELAKYAELIMNNAIFSWETKWHKIGYIGSHDPTNSSIRCKIKSMGMSVDFILTRKRQADVTVYTNTILEKARYFESEVTKIQNGNQDSIKNAVKTARIRR
jgi:hypothetical protein